jgi:hypothetical protein
MSAFATLYRRKSLFLFVFVAVFFTFTADVVDLREELRIISCAGNALDNSVATGLILPVGFNPGPLPALYAVDRTSSFEISFLHLMPCGLRAPPPTGPHCGSSLV